MTPAALTIYSPDNDVAYNQGWKWVVLRDPWPMWPVTQLTHDPYDPWPMAITSLHSFPTHGTRRGRDIMVLDNPVGLETIKITLGLSLYYENRSNCQLRTLQATAQLFYHHWSMGHWQWPTTHVTNPKMVTHLTHNPLTHFHLCL